MHIIVIKSCKSLNPGHPDSDKKDERMNRINTDKVDISKYATSGVTANCHQTWNKNPTPNPLPASDEGAKMYL
ncbi:hypothetical protein PN480_09495, partial [Dolichospermum circinale CS-1225]|uniref:hypothetical protein n=1 Tax=Dolichospermum circinale TaxID=109265 RepID=UPI002331484B